MRLTSITAIYTLFWSFSFFLVLPFRLRPRGRKDADEAAVPGQATSAPPSFSFGRTAFWTTIVSLVLFGLFYANYVTNFVPVETFDLVSDRFAGGR